MLADDSNAEIVGRLIAGEMTLQDAQKIILRCIDVGDAMNS